MHFIAVMLVIVAVFAFLVWRATAKRSVREQITNKINHINTLARRGYWDWRARERPLEQIDSSTLAATCVVVLAVRCERDLIPTDRGRIAEQAVRVFGIDRRRADELVAQAIVAIRNVSDEANWAARLARRLNAQTTEAERAQVLDMIRAIVPGGLLSHPQRHLAERYAHAAGLPRPLPDADPHT
jgi:hypothetical protein